MISNKMSNFELHPHIPEIRIYVLKYEPAILNVEFFSFVKKNPKTMRDRVKYFITSYDYIFMSVFVSATRFGKSL